MIHMSLRVLAAASSFNLTDIHSVLDVSATSLLLKGTTSSVLALYITYLLQCALILSFIRAD